MYFETIKSIEPLEQEMETYDLQVPNYNNFVLANGIVTHNSGKSTLASQLAFYVDPTFSLLTTVFTPEQLMKAIDDSHIGQAIVFDEAVMGMLAQDAATAVQSILIKKFVTIRKKRLFIFIVIPSIFMLRKYFSIFITRALIHTYTPDGIHRGAFKFYSFETKRKLYLRGLKEYDQGVVKPDFIGRFEDTEGYFFNADDYDDKKEEAIKLLTPADDKSKLNRTQTRQIKERHLFIAFSYNLFRYHVEWKNRFRDKNAKPLTAKPEDFSKFVKTKIGYSIGQASVKAAIIEAFKFLDQEKKMQEEIEKRKKKIENEFLTPLSDKPKFET